MRTIYQELKFPLVIVTVWMAGVMYLAQRWL